MREDILQKAEKLYGAPYIAALKFTSGAEGLFANHINDSGGMTYKGIARVYNSSWAGWSIIDAALEQFPELKVRYSKPPTSIKKLNEILNASDELNMLVIDFYYTNYFVKSGAKAISEVSVKAGVILFDISVLQGVKRCGKTIQRLLVRYYGQNLLIDGIVGSKTITAFTDACKINEDNIVNNLLLEFQDNLVEASKINNNAVFLQGWITRTVNLRNYLRVI